MQKPPPVGGGFLTSIGLLLHALDDAVGHAHQTLHLAGDDDLGGLTVGDLLHGLDGLQLQHGVVGCLFVQHLQGVGQGLLDGADGFGFALCLQDGGLTFRLRLQDGSFLLGAGPENGGFLSPSAMRMADFF